MKKIVLITMLVIFIAPSIVLASWWNPFTWKIFNFSKKEIVIPQTTNVKTNEVINTKKIVPVIKTPTIKESKKATPTVNIQKDNKAEIQAKLEADLKAEQDAFNKLSISNVIINSTTNSVKISWKTNIVSESKVILNSHEYISESGVGTTHQVNINGLSSNSSFNGSITAISNNFWQHQNFQFTTESVVSPPTTRCYMSESDYGGAPPPKLTCVPL